MNIFVTGASGFIGKEIVKELSNTHQVTACSRSKFVFSKDVTFKKITNLDSINKNDFKGIDVLIHTANIAHKKTSKRSIQDIHEVNFVQTKKLFKLAVENGIKQIIFLSSVSVYGESTSREGVNERSTLNPISQYAITKKKSEDMLVDMSNNTSTKYMILRMPMVYGLEAPGSFQTLHQIFRNRYFLPIPLLDSGNRRTFCSISRVLECINSVLKIKNQSYILNVANKDSLSTYDFIKSVAIWKKNKTLRISINDKFTIFFKKIPYLGNIFFKYYSDFVVLSDYEDILGSNATINTSSDLRNYLR